MNRGLITSLLQGFAKQKVAQNVDSAEPRTLNYKDLDQPAIDALFQRAEVLATQLCYPMQFTYVDEQGHAVMRLVSLKEVRREGEEYLFRCQSDDDHGHRIFSSSHMQSVTAGRSGYPVHNYKDFATRFLHFTDNDFVDIRRALHILLFLARSDGRYLPGERDVIHEFIREFCERRGEDPHKMEDYVDNAFIHYNVFMEAVRELDKVSKEDMQAIIATARKLVQADLVTAKEEERFYQQLEQALRGAA